MEIRCESHFLRMRRQRQHRCVLILNEGNEWIPLTSQEAQLSEMLHIMEFSPFAFQECYLWLVCQTGICH